MTPFVQALPEGPVDIVGDVHGEIEALLRLLHRLGVDPARRTAARPVVFVGDLVDRGPDSVAVAELVQELVEAGVARCILGNHELNILADDKKEGNGWFFENPEDHAQVAGRTIPFGSRAATPSEKQKIRAFFRTLPLVLERPDLRVVHAYWSPEAAAHLPAAGDAARLMKETARAIWEDLRDRGVYEKAREERAEFAGLRLLSVEPNRYLHAVAEEEGAHQSRNPIKVLTSGPEVRRDKPFFIAGRWRFVERDRWWRRPTERPTVVGHYWRSRGNPIAEKHDLWDDVGDWRWSHNVYCIDYSVGRRYHERDLGRTNVFDGGLGALRWPERVVVFDDRETPIQTA